MTEPLMCPDCRDEEQELVVVEANGTFWYWLCVECDGEYFDRKDLEGKINEK